MKMSPLLAILLVLVLEKYIENVKYFEMIEDINRGDMTKVFIACIYDFMLYVPMQVVTVFPSLKVHAVSRVEFTKYVYEGTKLLAVQIDAAINPGNSGAPVIVGKKVAGVAFQRCSTGENIG